MLQRILEPEVMDGPDDAADYDQMDHSSVNQAFVQDFLATWSTDRRPKAAAKILDLGTGTAQIPIVLCQQWAGGEVTADDLAEEMLRLARINVERTGQANRIRLRLGDSKQLSDPPGSYDAIISNSLVHHVPEPQSVLAEAWRVLRPGGLIFVRDLHRPATIDERDRLVALYASDCTPHQRQLFGDSLLAALTVDEVLQRCRAIGIPAPKCELTSDRHWTMTVWKP